MAKKRHTKGNGLFSREKHVRHGLLPFELAMLTYMVFTFVWMLLSSSSLVNPSSMLWGRLSVLAITLSLWGIYRLMPCRALRIVRILVQLGFLSWWYPDTYELNRILPNLDHRFAAIEQFVFGCQPALLFSKVIDNPVFSELMDLGYASYFPMIVTVMLFYIVSRHDEMDRAATVLLGSFFIYYFIFVIVPVVGPQYYYLAVGEDKIAEAVFPNVGNYFLTHSERMVSPGYIDGFFYNMVESAHQAGERPTAAFPSSHVGITTILLLLAWYSRSRTLFWLLTPFAFLMFFATIYIKAHYAIDSIAGLISGVILYYCLTFAYKKLRRRY